MGYHDAAMELAKSTGLLRKGDVCRKTDKAAWLEQIQWAWGMRRFERELVIAIPPSVKEFWQTPRLVYAMNGIPGNDAFVDRPFLFHWSRTPFLSVSCYNHHSSYSGVMLGSDDPPVYWGFLDDDDTGEEPEGFSSQHFSEYILGLVQNYAIKSGQLE